MVGEVSPDGNFVWDGESWIPKDEYIPSPEDAEETTNNVFQFRRTRVGRRRWLGACF